MKRNGEIQEKIDNKARILEPQRVLIVDLRDNELKAVHETVQSKMKSYLSLVAKSCSAALAPKWIKAAVRNVSDKHDRSKNFIINEKMKENMESDVEEIRE